MEVRDSKARRTAEAVRRKARAAGYDRMEKDRPRREAEEAFRRPAYGTAGQEGGNRKWIWNKNQRQG